MAEYLIGGGYYGEFSPEKKVSGDQFAVEDLLDFSNEDAVMGGDGFLDNVAANSADSSTATTVVDSCNSSLSGGENQFSGSFGSRSFGDTSFSGELCVPIDDLAELEWLSNFVEDSFSTKQNLQQSLQFVSLSNSKPPTPESSCSDNRAQPEPATLKPIPHPVFLSETPLPSKSRSKRSRAAPCDWTTRLLHLSPTKPQKPTITIKKRESPNVDPVPRKCLHCAAEKTPQWRTGPMGPKTLCNACGVRYKSGRLVPEYRPAASPTFMSTKHSNSHRKVLELRRQKEIQRVHQHQQHYLSQSSIFGVPNGGDDYLMNHCSGPSFRHMI